MDLLQSEISRKRKLTEQVGRLVDTKTKARRQEDIQATEQEILEEKQALKRKIDVNDEDAGVTETTGDEEIECEKTSSEAIEAKRGETRGKAKETTKGVDDDDNRKGTVEEDVGVCTHYSDDLERMGPEKVIYKYFKNLLHQWEVDLSRRTAGEANSVKGRADSNSLNNAKEGAKFLFKLCKKKEVPTDIRDQVMDMVKSCEAGNFRQAHDHYLQAAIGKAAWPIGVTSVGIHQRSGRERLSESKIAHVMNNEMQRKYFTAVKRLMTYAQTKRPDVPPSMKVL